MSTAVSISFCFFASRKIIKTTRQHHHTKQREELDDEAYENLFSQEDMGQNEIIQNSKFNRTNYTEARLSSTNSNLFHSDTNETPPNKILPVITDNSDESNQYMSTQPTFSGLMKLVSGSLAGTYEYKSVYENLGGDETERTQVGANLTPPTLSEVARAVAQKQGTIMDMKQYVTYEILCCTFLLDLVNEGNDPHSRLHSCLEQAISEDDDKKSMKELTEELKVRGGKDQLLMFLTGPAGAGKSTALKVARTFLYDFCLSLGMLWNDYTFFMTAYTGSAAMFIGGFTICKYAFIFKPGALTEDDKKIWRDVRILVIDEISFMNDDQLQKLHQRLQEIGDKNKPFGGFSIVFAGDFRQLPPIRSSEKQLLYSEDSSNLWNDTINTVIILDNKHRFKDDPAWGELMYDFWSNDLKIKHRKIIQGRRVDGKKVKLPKQLPEEAAYACAYNSERNAISAANFKDHILKTHPPFKNSDDLPPMHTIVIEGDIQSYNKKPNFTRINSALRYRILTTCGDADVKQGRSKLIDPALCLYVGAYLICTLDNKYLKEKVPRGNGTLCRLTSMKLKQNATTFKPKNFYDRKVWTVRATDVEWIEVEHVIKTDAIIEKEKEMKTINNRLLSCTDEDEKQALEIEQKRIRNDLIQMSKTRRFRIDPVHYSGASVHVKMHSMAERKEKIFCNITQFPVNLNDASTVHKLQGLSKDVLIITSWANQWDNWEYTILSRVRTREGLFLLKDIDMEKSFAPPKMLQSYMKKIRDMEKKMLDERDMAIKEFYGKKKK